MEDYSMTTRQLVNKLQEQGYNVTYRVRKDGGILITSVNGHKYKGATGNRVARMLLGEKISERRQAQLKKITRQRVKNPRKIRVETPEDLERFRKRVMRKWRKANLRGSISKRNLQAIIEDRGFKGAEEYLQEMERHAQGKAYYSAIEGLLARISDDIGVLEAQGNYEDAEWLQKAYDLINANKEQFKQEWLFPLFDELYNFENDPNKTGHDFYLKVLNLLS